MSDAPEGAPPAPEPAATTPAETPDLNAGLEAPAKAQAADASQAREMLRSAQNMYVRGDQVAGNKVILRMSGAEPAPLREVDSALLEPVRHAFVEPQDWQRTREAIRDRRLVLLRGEPGQGRVAAAIRLLQVPADRRIFHLERDIDLPGFPRWLDADAAGEKPLPLGAGFLLCDPIRTDHLDGWLLHQLATALEQRDARMVLTVNADLVPQDDDAREFTVPLGRPREHRTIMESHLRWRLSERFDGVAAAAMTGRILAGEHLAELTREALGDTAPVRNAASLALMIDQQFDGERVDLDRLRDQLGEREGEDFDIWFGALPDITARCLAIALAVLNGRPYEQVAHAARHLRDLLDGPPLRGGPAGVIPPWRDPFALPRPELVRMLRARTRQSTEFGAFGRTPVDVIEYIDADRPRSVLDHVWHRYQFQKALLDWLRDLSKNDSLDVRTYAGTALGVLTTYAFDFVQNYALREMALDDNEWSWDVVAYALRIPAQDPRLLPLVRWMTNRWHFRAAHPQLQATAARVRGLALGPGNLTTALNWLDGLALVDDRRVRWGIGNSFGDLLVEDRDKYGPELLERITRWQHDPRRTLCAQSVFQFVADNVLTYLEPDEAGGREEPQIWPSLLNLADRLPEVRPGLVACWSRVLNSGVMAAGTTGTLAGWAGWSEEYADVRTAFVRLLGAVASTSPRTRTLVLWHAANWVSPDALFPLPLTAAAVSEALEARTDVG